MTQSIAGHIRREIITNAATNMVFNGAIAWLLLKETGPLSWWGAQSFSFDIIATAFLLPGGVDHGWSKVIGGAVFVVVGIVVSFAFQWVHRTVIERENP